MSLPRKQWSWPKGLADVVYIKIRKWSNQYNISGRIHKSKRIPSERFGLDMPETQVIMRVHTLAFTFSELKWINDILSTEDPDTTQARIFKIALDKFEEAQEKGRATSGMQLPFELALTLDEVNYIRMLLECIGVYRRPTPSEKAMQKEDIAKADW